EVVVELLVRAGQATDEAPDLGRRSIAKGGLDKLERCGPPLGPRPDVCEDVGLELAPVGLGEQTCRLRSIEAKLVCADLGNLASGTHPRERDGRRLAAGEDDRQPLRRS